MADYHLTRGWSLRAKLAHYSRPEPSGCILWIGSNDSRGYGVLWWNGRLDKAYRLAWQDINGLIPKGKSICHHCDTPACINPDHLFLGTHLDNMRDRDAKGRGPRGSMNGKAKLTDDQVREIYFASGSSMREIGARYGVTHSIVSEIKSRKIWRHLHLE